MKILTKIFNNNFLEVFNSYENSENIYTLFSDGILLNKNITLEVFSTKINIFGIYV